MEQIRQMQYNKCRFGKGMEEIDGNERRKES
jgi:hypothetical protein